MESTTMCGKLTLCFVILLIGSCGAFELGYEYEYLYTTESDILGTGNLTTQAVVVITPVNHTHNGGTIQELSVKSMTMKLDRADHEGQADQDEMSLPFFMVTTENGTVQQTYYDKSETHDWLSFKMSIANILSHHKQDTGENDWTYGVHEHDSSGVNYHSYRGQRNGNAISLQRRHFSDRPVTRNSSKHIHLDPRGHVHSVFSEDEIVVSDGEDPTILKVEPAEGSDNETPIEDRDVRLRSNGQLTLTQRRHTSRLPHMEQKLLATLTKGSLVLPKPPPVYSVKVSEAELKIRKLLLCGRKYPQRDDRRRISCMHDIIKTLEKMFPGEVGKFAKNYLRRNCTGPDAQTCEEDKTQLLHLIIQVQIPQTQEIIVEFVLGNSVVIEERLLNAFYGVAFVKKPSRDIVDAMSNHCFGREDARFGLHEMSKVQRRACLALGAVMTNYIKLNRDHTMEIVEKFHHWMEHEIDRYQELVIERRFDDFDINHDKLRFIHTKQILLETIKNAAMPESKHIFIKYSKPNHGHAGWRHSAINGLLQYDCDQTATALLNVSLFDEHHNVRQKGLLTYKKHPRGFNISENDADIIAHKVDYNISRYELRRTKRDIVENLVDKLTLELHCSLPGIDWQKTIGSSQLNANFGVVARNKIDLHLSPTDGYIDVDVFDSAWVSIHFNLIIKFDIDVFKAELCYNGNYRFYNMSIMKDWTQDMMGKYAHLLDHELIEHAKDLFKAIREVKDVIAAWVDGTEKSYDAFPLSLRKVTKEVRNYLANAAMETKEEVLESLDDYMKKYNLPQVARDKVLEFINEKYDDLEDLAGDFTKMMIEEVKDNIEAVTNGIKDKIKEKLGGMDFDLGILEGVLRNSDLMNAIKDPEGFAKGIVDDVIKNNPIGIALEKGLRGLINEVVSQIRQIPEIIKYVFDLFKQLKDELKNDIKAAWSDAVRDIVNEVNNYKNSILGDAMKFYLEIMDIMSMPSQFATEVQNIAIDVIEAAAKSLVHSPKQAVADIMRGVERVKQAVKTLLTAKDRIVEAFGWLFNKERLCLRLGEEKDKLIDLFEFAIERMKDLGEEVVDNAKSKFTDKLKEAKNAVALRDRVTSIMVKIQDMIEDVSNGINMFKGTIDKYMNIVRDIKKVYELIKRAAEIIKNIAQKIFGVKYHKKFPHIIRDTCDDQCGCGVFPSKMFGRDGVQYLVNKGGNIVAPLDGVVSRGSNTNELILDPTHEDLKTERIMINYVSPSSDIPSGKGVIVDAGQTIGSASGSPCQPNFIFFAKFLKTAEVGRRKREAGDAEDADTGPPSDPTDESETETPNPRWVTSCSHTIYHNLFTMDGDALAEYFDKIKEDIIRQATDFDTVLDGVLATGVIKLPDGISKEDIKNVAMAIKGEGELAEYVQNLNWDNLKSNLKVDYIIDQFGHKLRTIVEDFPEHLANMKAFDLSTLKVNKILGKLRSYGLGSLAEKIEQLVERAAEKLAGKFEVGLSKLSIPTALIRNKLEDLGAVASGSVDDILSNLKKEMEKGIAGLIKGSGSLCQFIKDQQKITCELNINIWKFSKTLELVLQHDSCIHALNVTAMDKHWSFPYKDHLTKSKTFTETVEAFGLKATIDIKLDTKLEGSDLLINVSIRGCHKLKCTKFIGIIKNMPFDIPIIDCDEHETRRKRSIIDKAEEQIQKIKGYIEMLKNLQIKDLLEEFDKLDVVDPVILEVLEKLRTGGITALLDYAQMNNTIDGSEINEPFDQETSDKVDFPIKDITLWDVSFTFVVGPVPVVFRTAGFISLGVDFDFEMEVVKSNVKSIITPRAVAKVSGEGGVGFGWISAGLGITGYVMDNRFPLTLEVAYETYPVQFTIRLDGKLIPLRVKLYAYIRIKLGFVKKSWKFTIFEWAAPSIDYNIFTTTFPIGPNKKPEFKGVGSVLAKPFGFGKRAIDYGQSPAYDPYSSAVSIEKRGLFGDNFKICEYNFFGKTGSFKRSADSQYPSTGDEECYVEQLVDRDASDPAFKLEAPFSDANSVMQIDYAIGTFRGGTDVRGWTRMEGPSQVVPTMLTHMSHTLHFTVRAKNSEGLESRVQCVLYTYDSTIPRGRVEPNHLMTSRPDKLGGSLFVIDDTKLLPIQYIGIGVGRGEHGDQVLTWQPLTMTQLPINAEANGILQHFARSQVGRLSSNPFKTMQAQYDYNCAQTCYDIGAKCTAFDYNYETRQCHLHEHIAGEGVEGSSAELRVSGSYFNFERLTAGHSSWFEFTLPELLQGEIYYFNAKVLNELGYINYLPSKAIVVDYTPPEPGPIGDAVQDITRHDGCQAAITQAGRCIDVTPLENHRMIIDGPGGATLFNGPYPRYDLLYTLINHYITGNWDGFHDNETDIWGYTFGVGTCVCCIDIAEFDDPHSHLAHSDYWTHQGYIGDLSLPAGKYYVTVQALNSIVYGGALVTTVCHSTPVIVDTTPPILEFVENVFLDEDFDILAIYYKGTDYESGIMRTDVGLGQTKHDAFIRSYSRHEPTKGGYEMVSFDEVDLPEGVPIWTRVRVVNNVEMLTAGHGQNPIMLDTTAPVRGSILDGDVLLQDLTYQPYNDRFCCQWYDWHDPESGIDVYRWAIGTAPLLNDVVDWTEVDHHIRRGCVDVALIHSQTYYCSVKAFNHAINVRTVNGSSDGVLVDMTDPVAGWVRDGPVRTEDLLYTHKTATLQSHWGDFYDPESGIVSYYIKVLLNGEHIRTLEKNGKVENLDDHTFSFEHTDEVQVIVEATDGATRTVEKSSTGYVIDLTPPNAVIVKDHQQGLMYQKDATSMYGHWKFIDDESDIKEFRVKILQHMAGGTLKVWPKGAPYEIYEGGQSSLEIETTITGLNLKAGAKYTIQVLAINKALLTSKQDSKGVIVDTSPPVVRKVLIGMYGKDEDINDNGEVVQADRTKIHCTVDAFDHESGVLYYEAAIGIAEGDTSITGGFVQFDASKNSFTFTNLDLDISDDTDPPTLYYVTVKVMNGAQEESTEQVSKPIRVFRENIPGTVFDGRDLYVDHDYQRDTTSVGVSFAGFESSACGIRGYEWALGSSPGSSDIVPFSSVGIVMNNDTHGHAATHIPLHHGQPLYASVIAFTGHRCHEDIIHSSSDGMFVDNQPPVVELEKLGIFSNGEIGNLPLYQEVHDSIDLRWDVTDDVSGVDHFTWSAGSLPHSTDVHDNTQNNVGVIPLNTVDMDPGQTIIFTLNAEDKIGNRVTMTTPPITVDITPPDIVKFECNQFVSKARGELICEWETTLDQESPLTTLEIGIGNEQEMDDLMTFRNVSLGMRHWHRHMGPQLHEIQNNTFFVSLRLNNILGMTRSSIVLVNYEKNAPTVGNISVVTWEEVNSPRKVMPCQRSVTTIALHIQGFEDKESGIDSYEIAIGTVENAHDIYPYTNIGLRQLIELDRLPLIPGHQVFATVRALNKAGLFSNTVSTGVYISPTPEIIVNDGLGEVDADFQHQLTSISGTYKMKYDCPVVSASWKIYDLAGNVLLNKTQLMINKFENDEVMLENYVTYFVEVEGRDALGRSFRGRSNGITVLIEPPPPAAVRDGPIPGVDMNYQWPTTTLSANWDIFGSNSPGLDILYYEVAIGDDPSFPETRTNIHYYVNTGLDREYTFEGLNLLAKSVTYYITVRAHSSNGAHASAFSNGIKVGYSSLMTPGEVYLPRYTYNPGEITVSWEPFASDLRIVWYAVGISDHIFHIPNETLECGEFNSDLLNLNIKPLEVVGMDNLVELTDLNLQHNTSYYFTVVATDELDNCHAAALSEFFVDVTPPVEGTIRLGGISRRVQFVHDPSLIYISWEGFGDPESGVEEFYVQVFEGGTCDSAISEMTAITNLRDVKHQTDIHIYDLMLQNDRPYVVKITIRNKAGLEIITESQQIFVDISPPVNGYVRDGNDPRSDNEFQSSINTVEATIAINPIGDALSCSLFKNVQLSKIDGVKIREYQLKDSQSTRVVNEYNWWNVEVDNPVTMKIQRNISIPHVDAGAVKSGPVDIVPGDYVSLLTTPNAKHMITSFTLSEGDLDEYVMFDLPQLEGVMDDDTFLEVAEGGDLNIDETNTTSINTTTEDNTGTGGDSISMNSTLNEDGMDYTETIGIGMHILGQPLGDGNWYALAWIRETGGIVKQKWCRLGLDPTLSSVKYRLNLEKEQTDFSLSWKVAFYADDQKLTELRGIDLPSRMSLSFRLWSYQGYIPPLDDPFNPFSVIATVAETTVPIRATKLCHFGDAFYDIESSIEEVYIGLMNNNNTVVRDNYIDFELSKTLCHPCVNADSCEQYKCNTSCVIEPSLVDGYQILNLQLTGLSLDPGQLKYIENNDTYFDGKRYFVVVKVVNSAGLTSTAYSDGFFIDPTPPVAVQVVAVDNTMSDIVQSIYQFSETTLSAWWEFSEIESKITSYSICAGTAPEVCDVMGWTYWGTDTRADLDGLELLIDHTYYVTVNASNVAGLWTISSTEGITVYDQPPDVSNVTVEIPEAEYDLDIDVYFTTIQDALHLSVGGDFEVDVAGIEWSVGTAPMNSYMVPYTQLLVGEAERIDLQDGYYWFNHTQSDDTIISTNLVSGVSIDNFVGPGSIHLEPGRCLYHHVIVVNQANLKSDVPTPPVCIRKGHEHLVYQNDSSSFELDVTKYNVTATISGNVGDSMIQIAVLSDEDVIGVQYHMDTNLTYSPYIVDPTATINNSSRTLQKRIEKYEHKSLQISPVGMVSLTSPLTVSMSWGDINLDPEDGIAMAYWDPELRVWRHIEESCELPMTENRAQKLLTGKLCGVRQTINRKKRATADILQPTMISIFTIDKTIYNTAPELLQLVYTTEYNTLLETDMEYFDAEGDQAVFILKSQPQNGELILTQAGHLVYTPNDLFFGRDSFEMELTEVNMPVSYTPLKNTYRVYIDVPEPQMPPNIFLIADKQHTDGIQTFYQIDDNQNPDTYMVSWGRLNLHYEGNTTEKHLGTLYVCDANKANTIYPIWENRDRRVNIDLTNEDVVLPSHGDNPAIELCFQKNIRQYKVTANTSLEYHGTDFLTIIVRDDTLLFSQPLELQISVYISPCVHGECAPTGDYPCNSNTRTVTFGAYYSCACNTGYEGDYCTDLIRYCEIDPCDYFSDCHDYIGGRNCTVNTPKVAVSSIGSVSVVFVVFVILLVWFRRPKRHRKVHQSRENTPDHGIINEAYLADKDPLDLENHDGELTTDIEEYALTDDDGGETVTEWETDVDGQDDEMDNMSISHDHSNVDPALRAKLEKEAQKNKNHWIAGLEAHGLFSLRTRAGPSGNEKKKRKKRRKVKKESVVPEGAVLPAKHKVKRSQISPRDGPEGAGAIPKKCKPLDDEDGPTTSRDVTLKEKEAKKYKGKPTLPPELIPVMTGFTNEGMDHSDLFMIQPHEFIDESALFGAPMPPHYNEHEPDQSERHGAAMNHGTQPYNSNQSDTLGSAFHSGAPPPATSFNALQMHHGRPRRFSDTREPTFHTPGNVHGLRTSFNALAMHHGRPRRISDTREPTFHTPSYVHGLRPAVNPVLPPLPSFANSMNSGKMNLMKPSNLKPLYKPHPDNESPDNEKHKVDEQTNKSHGSDDKPHVHFADVDYTAPTPGTSHVSDITPTTETAVNGTHSHTPSYESNNDDQASADERTVTPVMALHGEAGPADGKHLDMTVSGTQEKTRRRSGLGDPLMAMMGGALNVGGAQVANYDNIGIAQSGADGGSASSITGTKKGGVSKISGGKIKGASTAANIKGTKTSDGKGGALETAKSTPKSSGAGSKQSNAGKGKGPKLPISKKKWK